MWISVDERPPEAEGWYLVKALYQSNRLRFFEHSDGFTGEVTHWPAGDDDE